MQHSAIDERLIDDVTPLPKLGYSFCEESHVTAILSIFHARNAITGISKVMLSDFEHDAP